MRLFRVEQQGYGVQSFRAFGNITGNQQFEVFEGPFLQTIDMIEDMGVKTLKFSNGPATIRTRDPAVEALMRNWD